MLPATFLQKRETNKEVVILKRCTRCKEIKDEMEFSKCKGKKDGLQSRCKLCNKQYRKENKEAKVVYMKEYWEKNKEILAEKNKQYRSRNKKIIIEKKKQYYEANKESIIEKSKHRYETNKEAIAKQRKKYNRSKALFDTYAHQLAFVDKLKRDADFLKVSCTFCKRWFNPTNLEVKARIAALNSIDGKECRFYCSDECKQSCSVYRQVKYPKGQKPYYKRSDQKEWSELVKERDRYRCIRCGSTEELIAHHIEGLNVNPLESADIDIGITLCVECDKIVHSEEGCRRIDLTKDQLCIQK